MRSLYNSYLKGGDELSYSDAKQILLHEINRGPGAGTVLMNRLHRMDMDNNGKISFTEMGNFLILRHCREVSLNKYIRERAISGNPISFLDYSGMK